MIPRIIISSFVILLSFCLTEAKEASYVNAAREFHGPQTFKDEDSGITFYLESDGRHIAAINREGKLIWHRDPFVDAKLEPYRYKRPQIVFVGSPIAWMVEGRKGKYIRVNYNTTQCLVMNVKNGDSYWMGQD